MSTTVCVPTTASFSTHPRADGADDPLVLADAQLASLPELDPDARARVREQVICNCRGVARREALRYRRSGEHLDDLIQVATIGLINAVDRFDPDRGVPFRHFVLPTITGELKRHFRDKGWSVRVSRRLQELHQEVSRTEPELTQRLGRTPTVADLAGHLGLSTEDVSAARSAGAVYSARSLNSTVLGDEHHELGDLLGELDRDVEAVADREALGRAMAVLPERLRQLVVLRYVDDLTQTQIADKIGVSQMHVSRLLSQAIRLLRRHILAERPWNPRPAARRELASVGG